MTLKIQQFEIIDKLLEKNMSDYSIAKIIECSPNTIKKYRDGGNAAPGPSPSPGQDTWPTAGYIQVPMPTNITYPTAGVRAPPQLTRAQYSLQLIQLVGSKLHQDRREFRKFWADWTSSSLSDDELAALEMSIDHLEAQDRLQKQAAKEMDDVRRQINSKMFNNQINRQYH